MVIAKNVLVKVLWLCGMLIMPVTIFLTASRAGFIDLVISCSVTLYYLRDQRKTSYADRRHCFHCGIDVVVTAGGKLYDRFTALDRRQHHRAVRVWIATRTAST